ncbi:hypothetical protein RSOL_026300 [Rhizoctonia solani AG-3 Rhs1AP]|uniref:Uncharacterized protein n=1 Tax=Rhizoctonia solani AG-3 Rhs1AP TaxID=1086054 RepID=X8IWF0_9AGAM|nr:hypothetical protein RSOL_026300 [Rhizoctonia solani AG-3 Rhs1AP]
MNGKSKLKQDEPSRPLLRGLARVKFTPQLRLTASTSNKDFLTSNRNPFSLSCARNKSRLKSSMDSDPRNVLPLLNSTSSGSLVDAPSNQIEQGHDPVPAELPQIDEQAEDSDDADSTQGQFLHGAAAQVAPGVPTWVQAHAQPIDATHRPLLRSLWGILPPDHH